MGKEKKLHCTGREKLSYNWWHISLNILFWNTCSPPPKKMGEGSCFISSKNVLLSFLCCWFFASKLLNFAQKFGFFFQYLIPIFMAQIFKCWVDKRKTTSKALYFLWTFIFCMSVFRMVLLRLIWRSWLSMRFLHQKSWIELVLT